MSTPSTVSARPAPSSLAPGHPDPLVNVPYWLVPASLLYLSTPHVVFLVSWIRPEIGIVFAVGLGAGLAARWRSCAESGSGFCRQARLGVATFSAGLTWLLGAGDLGYQALDS